MPSIEDAAIPLAEEYRVPSIEETARLLAEEYIKDDDGITAIYWAPSNDEVQLIEVTTSVPNRGEVLPFRFASDPPDIPYQSVVILLGTGDWTAIEKHELELPESFSSNLQQLIAR